LPLAAVIGAVWLLALAWLTIATSNPVTLNRDQVLRSFIVVQARVDDVQTGTCTVLDHWGPGEPGEFIRIRNLAETSAREGGEYLIPLSPAQPEDWMVTPTPLPRNPPLIYPATDPVREQLERILQRPEGR
jgi:hypothetical protein